MYLFIIERMGKSMKKTVVWGAGRALYDLLKYIENINLCPNDYIVSIVDSNSKMVGKEINEIPIISPLDLLDMDFDFICISSDDYFYEIRELILKNDFCGESSIINKTRFCMFLYPIAEYEKKYKEYKKCIPSNTSMKTDPLIIYTAITGDYDDLKSPIFIDSKVKYICFTNNPKLFSDKWEIRYVSDPSLSNVQLARKIKTLPFEFMDIDTNLLWVDAKYSILSDLRKYISRYLRKSSILCFPHFVRNNVCDETIELLQLYPYMKEKLIMQTGKYLLEGFKDDYGLYDTGCIYRDFSDEKVYIMMRQWWDNLKKYTHRDQVSFPYVCWKNAYMPDISDLFIEDNEYLRVTPHSKK